MKFLSIAAIGLATMAAPSFADGHATGDAANGEKAFKKCKSCHMIVADDETVIQKGGKTGPNLYGIYKSVPGSVDGFKYGKSLASIGEAGVMPDGWDSKAKSKMSFRLKDADDAADIWTYLVSVGPAE